MPLTSKPTAALAASQPAPAQPQLTSLRAHCAALSAQLDVLHAQLADALAREKQAQAQAQHWHAQAMQHMAARAAASIAQAQGFAAATDADTAAALYSTTAGRLQ